ncbi:Homeobox-like protein [Gracilaria domingensis]|nr:Homeobox-like protein [Gracilaria domingensis]
MSQHGPNHWKPVAEYVGKGMIKCQNHYESVYLQPTSSSVPFPVSLLYDEPPSAATPATLSAALPQAAPPPASTTNPPASAPPPEGPQTTNNDSPSAPKRDDFEVEWDDGAELLIADLNLQSEDPQEIDDALKVLAHFNARLHRRYAVKDYLMEGDILCFSDDDSTCLRQEQNLSNRLYALSWLLDPARFKAFYHAVMNEFRRAKTMYKAGRRQKAKRKARDLEANGKAARTKTAKRRRTNKARSTPFSKRKRSSAKKQDECPPSPVADATMPNTPASAPMSPSSAASPSLLAHLQPVHPSPAFLRKAKQLRRMVSSESTPPAPKPVDDMEDASQLSPAERNLCAALHIPPTFFLEMKSVTLLTVSALQQRRRNDKQSSSDKIVVPPANFAQDLDQVDEQSGSTVKKDPGHEENKDSLVLPPLTLPQVVNNHVLSNSGEQVKERGSPAQDKYETSQVMNQELLDFLTHIPENNIEYTSPEVKEEPVELGRPHEGDGSGYKKEKVKMELMKEEDALQEGNRNGVEKEEVKMELVKREEASLSEQNGREMVHRGGAFLMEDQSPVLAETAPEKSARGVENLLRKTSSPSESFPPNRNAPSYSSEGRARNFLPSPAPHGPASGASYKEPSPEGVPRFSSEDGERAQEGPTQSAAHVHPAAPPRERVYLRLSLRPPSNYSPSAAGGVNANPFRAGQVILARTSAQAHGQRMNPHGLGHHDTVIANGGSREGRGVSSGVPSKGRVYLRTTVHQAMQGLPVPLVNAPQVPNLNEPHTRSHLQLPQRVARFEDVCLPPGQRERDGNNATRAECVYPQQGTRTYLMPHGNRRVLEPYTAPAAVGCSQDDHAADPELYPQADADGGDRLNELGPLGSNSGQARGMPNFNASANRVYLQPQSLPPAPETPSVLVEPQSVHVGGHQARFQNEDGGLAAAPPDGVISFPPPLARISADEFEAMHGCPAIASAAGSAHPGGEFRTYETASGNRRGSRSEGEAGAGKPCIPDSSVGDAAKPPPTLGSSGRRNPQRVEDTVEDGGPEIEEILLDEGKAESEDEEASDSAPESPPIAPLRSKCKPASADPDYEPSFGSSGEVRKPRRGAARSTRRGQARTDGRHTRSGDQANRKPPQIVEDSEEIVSEGGEAESDDSIRGVADQERRSVRARRSLRTRRVPLPRSAVTPTRRSSRIQKRSRRLTDHSPDPRPLKKRPLASFSSAPATQIGVTAYVRAGKSSGEGQVRSSSIGPVNSASTRNSVNMRGRRSLGGGNHSVPRRSSGRVVKKTHKAKELEIITPQVDPQYATLSSDSNDSLRLMPPDE